MRDIKISGNHNVLNIGTQQSLPYESKVNVGVKVLSSTKQKLDEIARNSGKSTSELVREILESYLEVMPHLPDLIRQLHKMIP